MFSDDYELPSGKPADVVLKCSSPELDGDSVSGRTTPEGIPALSDIPLVKYVKWNVPTDDGGSTDAEGRTRRKAVAREILPDSETMRLKKSFSGSHRRRHSRKSSFEIGSAVEQGPAHNSDSEMEDKSKWRPSPACSPLSIDSASEKPEIESIPAISDLYRASYRFTSAAGNYGSKAMDTENVRLNSRDDGESKKKGRLPGNSLYRTPRKGCHRISDIAEALHPRSARSSNDSAALKILGSPDLNAAANYDTAKTFDQQREFILSPLPSTSQLRVAKAVQHSYDTDSQSVGTSSLQESGYSDMMGVCAPGEIDCWAREAAENPYSVYDEIQPRFSWLKRSVAPITALAGALLVFYGPRFLSYRRRQH